MEYFRCKDQGRRDRSLQLTHELVIEILSRLPVKSLEKFRCVCRSWNSTIARDSYLVTHHLINRSRSPNSSDGIISLSFIRSDPCSHKRPILQYSTGDDYSGSVSFDLSGKVPPTGKELHFYSVTNSCDGLIGVLDRCYFYIVNPGIRKLIALPVEGHGIERHDNYLARAAISFDASSGVYKAVRLFKYDSYGLFNRMRHKYQSTGCEVYTLRPGSCWKFVGDAPYMPYDETAMEICNGHLPVVVDGTIYWTVLHFADEGQDPDVALGFNLREERFDVIMHPEGSSRPPVSRVVSLGGRLCLVDGQHGAVQKNVWALTDYEGRKWVKLYKISTVENLLPVTIRGDGIMVLYDGRGRRDYYDPQTKNFIIHEEYFHYEEYFDYEPTVIEQLVTYTDSLVWPFA